MKTLKLRTITLFLFAASLLLSTYYEIKAEGKLFNQPELSPGTKIIYNGGDVLQRKNGEYYRCDLLDNEKIVLGKLSKESLFRIRHLGNYGTCKPGEPVFVSTMSLQLNGYKFIKK